ncbi:MAG: amidohydrolase family protein [bacterium]|nr:amidohydrolase [Deltaproteobacteria bacterium]MCP4904008.1 amidohydrolase family protein [bacterium]
MGGLVLREAWLARTKEDILEPERAIVDPHFHFFVENEIFPHYQLADLQRDATGHNVQQVVFMECEEGYRKDGPEHLRPIGESAWVLDLAKEAEQAPPGSFRISGMIGDGQLYNGALAAETLDAHLEASPIFRGVRDMGLWDASPEVDNADPPTNMNFYRESSFRAGFAELAKRGLVFDAHQYHSQLPSVAELARAFDETPIIVNHLGSPLGAGPYAGRHDEIFPEWQKNVSEVASCPNTFMKLGGLAMPWCGFGLEARENPPSSDEFVATYARYYDHALQVFGPDRCMFESNFPVDKLSLSYDVLWNGFKKIAAAYSEDEKEALFRGTATRVYRLEAL